MRGLRPSIAIVLLATSVFAGEKEIESLLDRAGRLSSLEVRRESRSIPLYREALRLARAGAHRELEARALVGLAAALISVHAYDDARATLRNEALPLTRRLGLRDLEFLAMRHLSLASVEQGRFDEALAWCAEMLRAGKEWNDSEKIARALNNTGAVRRRQGEFALALEAYTEASRLLETDARVRSTPLRFSIPYGLGRCLIETGDYPRALRYLEQARVAAEEMRHIGGVWHCLSDTGLWYQLQGDYRRAALFYERALAVSRSTDSRDMEAFTLRGIADAQRATGDLENASTNYRAALDIAERHQFDADTAMALLGLGSVAMARGDSGAARRHFDAALARAREIGQPLAVALVHLETGRLALGQRRHEEAEQAYRAALELTERLGFRSLAPSAYAGLAAAARARGELETSIALYAKSDEAIRRLRAAIPSAEQRAAFAAATYETYAGWIDALLAAGRPLDALVVVERERSPTRARHEPGAEATPIEADIARIQLRLSLPNIPAHERRELLGRLDDQEGALVRIESNRDARRDGHVRLPRNVLQPGEAYVALAETARGTVAFVLDRQSLRTVRLASEGDAADRIAFFTEVLQSDAEAARATGRRIANDAVMPWRALLAPDTRRLVISRSGVYARIPLAAVPDPAKNGQPLIASFEIVDVPSLGALAASRAQPPASASLLAIGVEQPRRVTIGGESFEVPSLPNTRREIAAIEQATATKPTVLLDNAAREDVIKRLQARSYSLIHFASHAFLDPRIASRSAIVLAPSPSEDGLLQTREIRQLRLDGSLVVLSSCSTALGPVSPADSMHSLGRACVDAGARAVVATFWDVRDRATATFFRRFYRHLARGIPAATALRAAQRETMARDPWANARDWAAFTIIGDGAVVPLRAKKVWWPVILIGVIAVAAASAWFLRFSIRDFGSRVRRR